MKIKDNIVSKEDLVMTKELYCAYIDGQEWYANSHVSTIQQNDSRAMDINYYNQKTHKHNPFIRSQLTFQQ